jgi:hypothetical protein
MKPLKAVACLFVWMLAIVGSARASGSGNAAGAVVLVNSTSAGYTNFVRFIQPYLGNFGVPYTVLDISSNAVGTNIAGYALIIIGHAQLDTNHAFLDSASQSNISAAVFNGAGLVNFDNALSVSNTPSYQFVQEIFGFGYSAASIVTNVTFPATEPSSQLHYITSLHPTNDALVFYTNMSLPGLTPSSNDTSIVLCGNKPLVAIVKYGQGRAVQWASTDWMSVYVLGPVNGLDDVLWRGLVWAARKPFVMRGMKSFATMRVDDVNGPFTWVHTANQAGFKPFVALFYSNVVSADADDLRGLVTNGNATASIHSFDCCSHFFYFDHANGVPYSDSVMSNNFALGTAWHTAHGIPISKMMIAHYSEIGPNAFAGLKAWGVEYVLIEVQPGTREYYSPYPPWLMLGPYRLYETPLPGQSLNPMVYADFLPVPGHPEFDGQFFDPYTEIRNAAPSTIQEGGDWAPTTDVAGTVDRGYKQIKRGLDSLTLGNVFTHESYIYPIPNATWLAIVQGVSNNLASYNPSYVTMDYANQYLRATRTSTLATADYDPLTGRISATFTGKTDLPINVYAYTGADSAITNTYGVVPVFTGTTNVTISSLPVPAQLLTPMTQNGSNVFTLAGQYGRSYSIESATPDLLSWTSNLTVTLSNGLGVVNMPWNASNQFYRARLLP